MRIVDAHAHLLNEPGYLDGLLRAMDACGIERVCLSGLGPLFGHRDNRAVAAAVREHPDRIVGAWFARPGVDAPDAAARARDQGFRMLKVTVPRVPYDDPSLYPLWQGALAHGLPVLFHTGIVAPVAQGRGAGVSSWFMHPMRVEPVTREFPDLKVILAHLGVNWNMDAAELARMRPNVYVDLTGEPDGWRVRLDRHGAEQYLWWPDAFAKVVFGTDVHHTRIARILDEDRARLERLGVGAAVQRRVFARTILSLLGMETDDGQAG